MSTRKVALPKKQTGSQTVIMTVVATGWTAEAIEKWQRSNFNRQAKVVGFWPSGEEPMLLRSALHDMGQNGD